MKTYHVVYKSDADEKCKTEVFKCQADDEDHAHELCLTATLPYDITDIYEVEDDVPPNFVEYDNKVRTVLATLALIKPPEDSDPNEVRRYLESRLMEFGIL